VTQDRLAERCELAPDTIRRLEHGAFSPSLDTLTKLCVGLQISRSTLFESFELGERDPTREIVDLLFMRTRREVEIGLRLLRTLFDDLDDLGTTPVSSQDDADDDEPAV